MSPSHLRFKDHHFFPPFCTSCSVSSSSFSSPPSSSSSPLMSPHPPPPPPLSEAHTCPAGRRNKLLWNFSVASFVLKEPCPPPSLVLPSLFPPRLSDWVSFLPSDLPVFRQEDLWNKEESHFISSLKLLTQETLGFDIKVTKNWIRRRMWRLFCCCLVEMDRSLTHLSRTSGKSFSAVCWTEQTQKVKHQTRTQYCWVNTKNSKNMSCGERLLVSEWASCWLD